MPTSNIKVVIRETGLKPDTLQAWELCDGLPNPQRTSGGHRVYSQYDIEMVKWLIELQNEGLRINYAIDLLYNFEKSGQHPLQVMSAPEQLQQTATVVVLSGGTLDQQRQPVFDWSNSIVD